MKKEKKIAERFINKTYLINKINFTGGKIENGRYN